MVDEAPWPDKIDDEDIRQLILDTPYMDFCLDIFNDDWAVMLMPWPPEKLEVSP